MERKLKKGGKVWVRDRERAWVEGIVLGRDRNAADGSAIVVQLGRELKRRGGKTRVVNARTDCEVRRTKSPKVYSRIEDLTAIDTLHEPGLLEALEERFNLDKIYTYTGKILLAVNPFKQLAGTYGPEVTRRYIEASAGDEMPAHVYGVASRAFKDVMERGGLNQTLLVSGESGAGKTETTKIVMRSLTEMSQWRSGEPAGAGGATISDRVLESNPVLETFGNACTIRNDNSSRFGKLIELQFDRDSGRILEAHITTYLLEKARLTYQFPHERNFHVFYEMAAGGAPEQLARWRFDCPLESFNYISQVDDLEREDQSDAYHFDATLSAMRALGISEEEIGHVFDIAAGVLHLGNLEFETFGADQACRIKFDDATMHSCIAACDLLQVDADALERSLCRRIIRIRPPDSFDTEKTSPLVNRPNEEFEKPLTSVEAAQARDALAMTIYERLFGWLVWRLNQCICAGALDSPRDGASGAAAPSSTRRLARRAGRDDLDKDTVEIDDQVFFTEYTIGLLDVFGFEVFERNGFEQLCINYCNERLQQLFNDAVFHKDQQEYDDEGIDWQYVKFPDNRACLDMIESKPIGLLALIDENCMYPRGNDQTMCNKMYEHLVGRFDRFLNPTREERANYCFTIRHFAGLVTYSSDGFFRKNKNELRQEAVDLVCQSRNPIAQVLLPADAKSAAGGADIASYFETKLSPSGALLPSPAASLASPNGFASPMSLPSTPALSVIGGSSTPRTPKPGPQSIQQRTVGGHFKAQLKTAIENIQASSMHYIRCLKPNDENIAGLLDRRRLVDQLRYSGVLQVIQVARAGYPFRFSFAEFLERYAVLAKRGVPYKARRLAEKATLETQRRNCVKIAHQAQLVHGEEYQAGKTKVFLRQFTYTILEVMREERYFLIACVLQRVARRFLSKLHDRGGGRRQTRRQQRRVAQVSAASDKIDPDASLAPEPAHSMAQTLVHASPKAIAKVVAAQPPSAPPTAAEDSVAETGPSAGESNSLRQGATTNGVRKSPVSSISSRASDRSSGGAAGAGKAKPATNGLHHGVEGRPPVVLRRARPAPGVESEGSEPDEVDGPAGRQAEASAAKEPAPANPEPKTAVKLNGVSGGQHTGAANNFDVDDSVDDDVDGFSEDDEAQLAKLRAGRTTPQAKAMVPLSNPSKAKTQADRWAPTKAMATNSEDELEDELEDEDTGKEDEDEAGAQPPKPVPNGVAKHPAQPPRRGRPPSEEEPYSDEDSESEESEVNDLAEDDDLTDAEEDVTDEEEEVARRRATGSAPPSK